MNNNELKTPQQLADAEIITRVLAGEKRLYEQLMRRYNARLYRTAMSIVNDDAAAEELMQIAYINAYEHLAGFGNRAAFGTWLTRIMINECLHYVKKNKRFTGMEEYGNNKTPEQVHGTAHTPVQTLMNKELGKVLENALQQLPEKYRLVFMLREVEEMSIAETVETLNITEANVKVRLNRAKTMLRDTLGGYYKNGAIYNFHLSRCDRVVNNVLNALGI